MMAVNFVEKCIGFCEVSGKKFSFTARHGLRYTNTNCDLEKQDKHLNPANKLVKAEMKKEGMK